MGKNMKKSIKLPMGFKGKQAWTFQRFQKNSPHGIIAIAIVCALNRGMGETQPALEKAKVDTKWKLEAGSEYYYWQENDNGRKLLDESGPRYAMELSAKTSLPENWLTTIRFKAYYGHVNYDGQTQGGTPLKSTTDYYGGLVDCGAGYRWTSSKNRYLDLIGRFGVEDWQRDLNGSGGYGENWLPFYFKAGFETSREREGWTAALGVKIPIYTWQHVDLSKFGAGTLTLHPDSRPSPYAEFGYVFTRHLSVTAYFDSYWFSQSPTVSNGYVAGFQPESITYQAGLKAGWTF